MQANNANVNNGANPCSVPTGKPLRHIEKIILEQKVKIEAWFAKQWLDTPPSITTSVDLRNAGFKLAPIDTNLFPAGFNNLHPDSMATCVQAIQLFMQDRLPHGNEVLLIPESHTRSRFYWQSVYVLQDIFKRAGFVLKLGSLDPQIIAPQVVTVSDAKELFLEPLQRTGDKLHVRNFTPDMILLNNDLSAGIPDILANIAQPMQPPAQLGWGSRLKSSHFQYFNEVAQDFAQVINIDPWFINPYFTAVAGIDFMAQEDLQKVIDATDGLLAQIKAKYVAYDIKEEPFVVIKADNGTYGMSVMMIHSSQELTQLNRKQRKRMAASKGGIKVERVMVQEGVPTVETMQNDGACEPVAYMLGPFVVGGFYRIHQERGSNENLNAPGMNFAPFALNASPNDLNRFYVYGVIARLAALAAAKEIKQLYKE